jgi:dTDP-4-dehydrorhamnose reductase
MTLLVTGTHGLLGQYLIRICSAWPGPVVFTGRGPCRIPEAWMRGCIYAEMDITDPRAIDAVFGRYAPDAVIHAAAEAQPDACELDKGMADLFNTRATEMLLEASGRTNACFVYLSTDFIFDGDGGPYSEESTPSPVNHYGVTKLRSEERVRLYAGPWAVVRTALVYGLTLPGTRSNIVTWVWGELDKQRPIRVVGDQVRTPTYAADLADVVLRIARQGATGVWHVSGKDVLTPYDIALVVADRMGYDKGLITRVDASSFTQPAVRPLRTPFDISKARALLNYVPLGFEEAVGKVLGMVP